jgi:ABC-2 type transport system ATP-binding protein
MVGRLYHMPSKVARQRASDLLEQFELTDASDRIAKTYSGGMRRRLDLAAGLVLAPPVLFLDEPTTGLDPRSRLGMWDVIRELVADGTTLLLTTQYLEEADRLANQIAVIDHGRVIAEGTADQLKARVGGERLALTLAAGSDRELAIRALGDYAVGESQYDAEEGVLLVPVANRAGLLASVIRELDAAGVQVDDIGMRRPTLDDVFLALTGHAAEAERDAAQAGDRELVASGR